MLIKSTFLKSLQKIVRNMYQPAQSDDIFLKVGTPNVYECTKSYKEEARYLGSKHMLDTVCDSIFFLFPLLTNSVYGFLLRK